MGQIVTKHFEADGNAVNLNLGFIPSYVRVTNFMAADTEVAAIEWFKEMGDAVEIWWNNSDTGEQNFVPKSSGGYISAYDASQVGVRKSCTFDYTGGAMEDLVTCAGHGYVDGEAVKFVAGGGLATGLSALKIYYVRDVTLNTFRVSETRGGAVAEMTSDGTPPNYVFSIDNLPEMPGGKGITIAAAFMDDSDEIYVLAMEADRDMDEGDINA